MSQTKRTASHANVIVRMTQACVLGLVWLALSISPAMASGGVATGGGLIFDPGKPESPADGLGGGGLKDYNIASCPGEGIASRFVPCIRAVVVDAAYLFFDNVYPLLESAIYAALTLAVILYGVMLVTQWIPTPKASTETFVFIIKIGAVVGFTSNIEIIYNLSISLLDGFIYSVTNYSFSGYGGFALRCPPGTEFQGASYGPGSANWMPLWHRIDCVLDRIVGINARAGEEISSGILAFLWDNAFTGAMGIMVFIGGLYMIASLVMGLFRAIAQYIISLMLLGLIVMTGLIFIPFILFRQTAMEYFRKWLRIFISTILQPVVVFAFMSVLITALDVTMFSGPNSFYRTVAGDNSNAADFSLSRYMVDRNLYRARQAGPYVQDNAPLPDQRPTAESGRRDGISNPDDPRSRNLGSLNELLVGIEYKEIDWARLCNARGGSTPTIDCGNANETMREAVGNSLIMSIITVFLLLQIMNQIPRLAQDLTGGARETVDTGGLAGNTVMSQGLSNATGNMTQRISNLVTMRSTPGGGR
jgi:hypothetical protein